MITIETYKIKRSTLCIQLVSLLFILAAYTVSRPLMLLPAALCTLAMLQKDGWEQKLSILFFLVPFSGVFNLGVGQTSLFMSLRLAVPLSFLLFSGGKFKKSFMLSLMLTVFYWFMISTLSGTSFLVTVVNLVLWLVLGYIIMATLPAEKATPVTRSLTNGVIAASLVGMNLQLFPILKEELVLLSTSTKEGLVIARFAGLSFDPNLFTVLICICLWALFFEYRNKRLPLWEYLVRVVAISAFGLMTMSKSCILLLAVYWLVTLMMSNSMKLWLKGICFAVIAVAMVFFIQVNPEWVENFLYRMFGSGYSDTTIAVFTTGRTEIWQMYLDSLDAGQSWFFGNGIGGSLPDSRASHSTILQVIYNSGIVGLILYVLCFFNIYKGHTPINTSFGINISKMAALFSLLATMFFLDGMFQENYYYVLPLCFIYLRQKGRPADLTKKDEPAKA